MNSGLDRPNFSRDMGYRAENLAMDKLIFIAKIQLYFFLVPKIYFSLAKFRLGFFASFGVKAIGRIF